MKCLYQFGNYKIYEQFSKPTFELFQNWRVDFLNNNDLENYKVLFMGNAAEQFFGQSQISTTDIDIIIHSPIIDYNKISTILNSAFQIGLSYNLLIDIYFVDTDIFSKPTFDKYYSIRFYKEIVVDESKILMVSNATEFDILPNGLWGIHRTESQTKSYQKYIDRINSGQYLGLKFDLKTMKLISYN